MLNTKLTVLTCMLLIPFVTNAQEQQQSTAQPTTPTCRLCPTINVTCPERALTGSIVNFSAQIDGAGPDPHLTFAWAVSGGTITEGQGTPMIKVDTTGLSGQPITATIEVNGLEVSCSKSNSCAVLIMPIIADISMFDSYGRLSLNDERARLDNFANQLIHTKNGIGYIIIYGGRRVRIGEVQRRGESAKNYLLNRRQIAAKRIVLIDGGYRDEATTELWIIPQGLTPPTAVPTVDLSEVVVIAPHKQKRRVKNQT